MILFIALWYLVGLSSFIYWWTTEYDFTMGVVLPAALLGLMGPIAFFVGWSIHGKQGVVIIKRRR